MHWSCVTKFSHLKLQNILSDVIYQVVILHLPCMNILKLCNKIFPWPPRQYWEFLFDFNVKMPSATVIGLNKHLLYMTGKGTPIRHVLGKSKMILGLLEGIPSMLKGEVAMVTFSWFTKLCVCQKRYAKIWQKLKFNKIFVDHIYFKTSIRHLFLLLLTSTFSWHIWQYSFCLLEKDLPSGRSNFKKEKGEINVTMLVIG